MPGGPQVNLASSNEHVPEIERRIRVVKERCRATRHSLPFQRLPKLLTIHIVFHAVKLLNFFPTKGGISETLSPKTIMSGETLDYKKHLCLPIGQYCQVHEEELPRNSLRPRTKGAISLGPSGNLQGGHKFMALNTGKKIVRRSWDVIPMPDTVIARVNTLGADQPEQLVFTDRHGRLIGDDDDVDMPGVDDEEMMIKSQECQSQEWIADLTGVDEALPEVEEALPFADEPDAPQVVDIDDLDTPAPDPPPIETVTAEPAVQEQTPATHNQRHHADRPEFDRKRSRMSQQCQAPSYSYAVTQLETQGVLNPDAHMFVQEDFYQSEPDVVAAVHDTAVTQEWSKGMGRQGL